MEKYLTLSLGKYLVFKDSLQFLGSSLATLSKNREMTGLESVGLLRKRFHGFEAEDMMWFVRKVVYPYEDMDSWKKMDEQQIPPKEAFYSKLTDTGIQRRTISTPSKCSRASNVEQCGSTTASTLCLCFRSLSSFSSLFSFSASLPSDVRYISLLLSSDYVSFCACY